MERGAYPAGLFTKLISSGHCTCVYSQWNFAWYLQGTSPHALRMHPESIFIEMRAVNAVWWITSVSINLAKWLSIGDLNACCHSCVYSIHG